ncbi:uncharacterized protein KY384_000780 [Bacidia gigantensis]|uniref:uncharacterized protein n=1 Tax=Bacidia gigantensis TaxID=2732470 RepID=UPI001D04043A|nr:uncharacterized protein KY384_000780 [Bacidia gigantensis]KAG8526018.1 hypothetical protein KY384_000780 [Bacidia gigantensis]
MFLHSLTKPSFATILTALYTSLASVIPPPIPSNPSIVSNLTTPPLPTTSNFTLGWIPEELTVTWAPTTGPLAGAFTDLDAYESTISFLSQAVRQPFDEAVRPQTFGKDTVEIYVSGLPAGSMIQTNFLCWGFNQAFFAIGQNERGFIEFREPSPRTLTSGDEGGDNSTVTSSSSALTSRSDNNLIYAHVFLEHQPHHEHRQYYVPIISAMAWIATAGIDKEITDYTVFPAFGVFLTIEANALHVRYRYMIFLLTYVAMIPTMGTGASVPQWRSVNAFMFHDTLEQKVLTVRLF